MIQTFSAQQVRSGGESKFKMSKTRRQFIKMASAVVAAPMKEAVMTAARSVRTHKRTDGNQPVLRFMQINDTHVYAGPPHPDDHYALANERFQWVVQSLGNSQESPDFILGLGDLIDGVPQRLGDQVLYDDLKVFKDMIRPLRLPFYPIMGNHEVMQREGNPVYERPYRNAFGNDRVNYSFEKAGIVFVMLNNSGATNASREVIHARNEWLRQTLEGTRRQPKILCCHIPLVPFRDEGVLSQSFGFKSYHAHDPVLLGLVEKYADTCIAVLCGHLHLTGMVRRNDIFHVCLSGTASSPCDYGALYNVFKEHIEVEIKHLPDKLAKPTPDEHPVGFLGSIHGKPRHTVDFVDSDHASATEYQEGRADERRFTIDLPRAKQPSRFRSETAANLPA